MLTASHNPAEYNGFKVKRYEGCSVLEDEAKWIEREANDILDQEGPPTWAPAREHTRFDAHEEYVTRLLSLVDTRGDPQGEPDGGGGHDARGGGRVLRPGAPPRGSATVHALRADPNPTFDGRHPEPLGPNLVKSRPLTADPVVDLGVATDGDADRFGMMAHGEYFDVMRAIVYLLYHLLKNRGRRGAWCVPSTSPPCSIGCASTIGVTVIETSVGFKNIAPLMIEYRRRHPGAWRRAAASASAGTSRTETAPWPR